ncbi:unnamed protein product [Ascophyllum nodosum]
MSLAMYLMVVNLFLFIVCAQDKLVAMGWLPFLGRIPETLLHQIELGGGTPGSFLAQRLLRHKISKVLYQRRFSQILLLQMVTGSAWCYFQGPSWALLGFEILWASMFADTIRRVSTLNERERRQDQRRNKISRPPWQKPISLNMPTRFGGGTSPPVWRGAR